MEKNVLNNESQDAQNNDFIIKQEIDEVTEFAQSKKIVIDLFFIWEKFQKRRIKMKLSKKLIH